MKARRVLLAVVACVGCTTTSLRQPVGPALDVVTAEVATHPPFSGVSTQTVHSKKGKRKPGKGKKEGKVETTGLGEEPVVIYPGETVIIEATVVDGEFVSLKRVKRNRKPKTTFVFMFSYFNNGRDMLLYTEHPFDKPVKYHIDMLDREGKPENTTSCPLRPGVVHYEHWQYRFAAVSISNFHFLGESETMDCVY